MDAQAINTIGGVCEIAGLLLAVRDLLAVHEYRGEFARLRSRLGELRNAAAARWRQLRGQRGQDVYVHAEAALGMAQSA